MSQAALFQDQAQTVTPDLPLAERAQLFCETAPHRRAPYAARNWGGPIHSLCSYQGKLKPAIASFLVEWFTSPGDRVFDPMAGVGTIPLEARKQHRIGIAGDLSPLAVSVSRAKLEPFDPDDVVRLVEALRTYIGRGPALPLVPNATHADFGLNKTIREYFHEETLREILLAREFFLHETEQFQVASRDVALSSLLHILHGNRPYALSRRSHPVTPLAPSGPTPYKSLIDHLTRRLTKVVPILLDLPGSTSHAFLNDFRTVELDPVDCVITSPPFSDSFRFWSMNWMRLWFAGWEPEDFKTEPTRYLETQQKKDFSPYADFSAAMARVLRPGGLLVMHLGETAKVDMGAEVAPLLEPHFEVVYRGRECVLDTESYGLSDKGSTLAHQYLFAVRT